MTALRDWLLGLAEQRRLNAQLAGLVARLERTTKHMSDSVTRFDADLDALQGAAQAIEDEVARLKAAAPADFSAEFTRLESLTSGLKDAVNPPPAPTT